MDEERIKRLEEQVEKLDRLVYKLFKRLKELAATNGQKQPAAHA